MGGQKKGEEIQSDGYWSNMYSVSYPEFFPVRLRKWLQNLPLSGWSCRPWPVFNTYAGSCPLLLTSFPSRRRQEASTQTLMHTWMACDIESSWKDSITLLMCSNGSYSQPAAGETLQEPWGHKSIVQELWIPVRVQWTHFILSIVRSLKSPAWTITWNSDSSGIPKFSSYYSS